MFESLLITSLQYLPPVLPSTKMDYSEGFTFFLVRGISKLARELRVPEDTLIIPFCLSVFLVVTHGAYMLVKLCRRCREEHSSMVAEEDLTANALHSLLQAIQTRAKAHGGWIIYSYELFLSLQCPESFMTVTYIYAIFWSLFVLCMVQPSKYGTRSNNLVLVASLLVYVYRDIWPYATYIETPKDAHEGYLLWAKIGTLFVTAALIPLFVPRRYTPVDPKNPMTVPNPELTCSFMSFITYSYLTPVILAAQKTEHLGPDKLPPLSDTDVSKNLVRKAFPYMDPLQRTSKRHIFFGLFRTLRMDYIYMTFAMIVMGLAEFISPIGIYHILSYLEHGTGSDSVQPWFWILALLCGPSLQMISFQYYVFLGTRILAHVEAILTALVFEHSLRIRFAADVQTDEQETRNDVDAAATSKPASDNVSEASVSGQSTIDAHRSTSNKGKSPASSISKSSPRSASAGSEFEKTKPVVTSNLVGKINNFVTTDLVNITDARHFIYVAIGTPVQISISAFFLYKLLGWSSLVGIGCLVVLLPVPGYLTKLIQDYQKAKMKKSDKRIQIISEVVNALRMIKLFGWETKMLHRIEAVRNDELLYIWWLKVLRSIMGMMNSLIPTIAMLATYTTYTVVMKQELTPSVIFSSLTVFDMLRLQLFEIYWSIADITQAKVSLDRLNEFFNTVELLDLYTEDGPTAPAMMIEEVIGFKNASFAWSLNSAKASKGSAPFKLHVNGELFFKSNCINLIVGPTGSGKTSMLMALLGEMHFIKGDKESWFNLPRGGGVAYAAQESWVQNKTIRENILFGSPYDEARYKQVLAQSALERDLELFEAGDNTEVGEKGVTLSGGQKARLTLARAIYSPAKVILLDDVLAALDVHTSATIVKKCFQGNLVKNRTVILVTHNLGLMLPISHFVVSIGRDGKIASQVNDADTLALGPTLVQETQQRRDELDADIMNPGHAPVMNEPQANGRLTLSEEIVSGHVTLKSLKLFFTALGNGRPILFFTIWLSTFVLGNAIFAFQKWFLGYWGSQYEAHEIFEVNVSYYCSVYACILVLFILVSRLSHIYFIAGTVSASRVINSLLVESVLGSTLRWMDKTPTARIIARFTKDIQSIDDSLPQVFYILSSWLLTLFTSLAIVCVFTPFFVAPALVIAAFGFYIGNIYVKAQLSTTREKSNARAPVLSQLSSAITGIVSVRAYGAQSKLKEDLMDLIDRYSCINRITYNLNRWVAVRIDILGGAFSTGLATYLVYGRSIGSSNSGFTLNMTAELCTALLYSVRFFNEFEVQANSLERIQGYLDINHEEKAQDSRKPPASWPTSGELIVKNLTAQYSEGGPVVLHGISFRVKSGERIGIVGRTGSGKSSLTLALLRLIITKGNVYYDGIETGKINLEDLRSNITIIPQIPELICGTLRHNLDPFEQYDDAELNDALHAAGLCELKGELGKARITLDSNIASAGRNLSFGERQVLALARAMIRRSKLLILDEATSAIDHKTDAVIQNTLRHKLDPSVTVITVAHRLQTIMDADRVMVLDDGFIVEFDSPKVLLGFQRGLFKSVVDNSSDRELLYDICGATTSSSNISV